MALLCMRKSLEGTQNCFLEASIERLVDIDIGVISCSRTVIQYFKGLVPEQGLFHGPSAALKCLYFPGGWWEWSWAEPAALRHPEGPQTGALVCKAANCWLLGLCFHFFTRLFSFFILHVSAVLLLVEILTSRHALLMHLVFHFIPAFKWKDKTFWYKKILNVVSIRQLFSPKEFELCVTIQQL